MKSKRYLVAAPAVLALALAGCGGSTGNTNSGSGGTSGGAKSGDCSSKDVLCVGLVTDTGKIDDKSFNQSAWEGVQAAKPDQMKYVETTDTKDYANNIKQFTDKKFDVIVTVGFLMAEATVTAATENPETAFIGVDQFQAKDVANVTGLTFPEDQAGYGVGYLAGLMTKSNTIGQVLGQQIPPVEKYAKGYEAGAKAANPKIKVVSVYHPAGDNAFTDPVWGAGEAKKQLSQGADIVFAAGGKTGNGALGETAKADGAGEKVFCVGVDQDQWDTVPEAQKCLITSAMKLIDEGVTDLIGQSKDGTIKGGNFTGKVGLAPYHDFESKVPAEVKAKVEAITKKMEDGTLQTGVKLG